MPAISDGAGGWYLGGDFTSVGGVLRPGLAHLLATGTLDATFAPPALGEVNALVLDAGRLYVGGAQFSYQPFLGALDPATGAALPISFRLLPNISGGRPGVVALAAGGGRLYAVFNSANGIAAYDEASGALRWNRPVAASSIESGPAALALVGGRLLLGGRMSNPTDGLRHDLQELDPADGTIVAEPSVGGPVTEIATAAHSAYIIGGRSNHESLWKLDLSSGKLTRRAACHFCSAVTINRSTLYVAKWAPARGDLRVYSLNLRKAKPSLRALSQVLVGGSADTLALQNGRLLVGGSFLGLGGAKRTGLAAFDARTGALLPWRPRVAMQPGVEVDALAHSGNTIYLAGDFTRVSGKPRQGLAAVSALGRGKLLPWNPRVRHPEFTTLAVAGGRVFASGPLTAFSAKTGRQLPFKSNPRLHVATLAVWHNLLLVGGDQGVTALQLSNAGRPLWNRPVQGERVPTVFALQTSGSTLYAGGRFSRIDGRPRTNLAALALDQSGAPLNFAPQIPNQVMALATTDYGLVFSTLTLEGQWGVGEQALGAVSPGGQLLPWQISYPPSDEGAYLNHLASVPGGLVATGLFSWIGPLDNPAPGGLAWLR